MSWVSVAVHGLPAAIAFVVNNKALMGGIGLVATGAAQVFQGSYENAFTTILAGVTAMGLHFNDQGKLVTDPPK